MMKRILCVTVLCLISLHSFASDVTLDLKVDPNNRYPLLAIETNLPPGTLLATTLTKKKSKGEVGYFAQEQSSVQITQATQLGPFSQNGKQLEPGIYQITVSTAIASLQPPDAQSFFGPNGSKLTGQHVSNLPGTNEKIVTQTFQYYLDSGAPSNLQSFSNKTVGSDGETWKSFKSDGKEIFVRTNGFFYTKERYSNYGFRTYIVTNLPASQIVGAPQSVMNQVEGNCETKTFHVLGSLFFAGKDRTGVVVQNMPAENVERRLVKNSPFEKAFDFLCKTAKEQKQ